VLPGQVAVSVRRAGRLLLQVLRECGVGVSPFPEVMQFAPDFLCPPPGGMREEREVGVWLARFAWPGCRPGCRMSFGPTLRLYRECVREPEWRVQVLLQYRPSRDGRV
jgi:hypothetical protein